MVSRHDAIQAARALHSRTIGATAKATLQPVIRAVADIYLEKLKARSIVNPGSIMRRAGIVESVIHITHLFPDQLPFFAAAIQELQATSGIASPDFRPERSSRVLTSLQRFTREHTLEIIRRTFSEGYRKAFLNSTLKADVLERWAPAVSEKCVDEAARFLQNSSTIYYRTLADCCYLALEKKHSIELAYKYLPTLPAGEREACKRLQSSKPITRAAIAKRDEEFSPAMIWAGGYNCPHSWVAVDICR